MTHVVRIPDGAGNASPVLSSRQASMLDHGLLPHIRPAVVLLLLFTVLTGIAYPLAVTGLAQVTFPARANGSLLTGNGNIIGSSLIGQSFVNDRYFHPRPSATGAPDPNDASKTVDAPYNGANSGGSNLGPLSKVLHDRIAASVEKLKASGVAGTLPADSVTTSASGLDPHVSPAFALLQVGRVAKARHLPEDKLRQLVQDHIERPLLGVFGEPQVNVLGVNLALDALSPS